ncbi:MAG TPA: acyl carrier protein [Pseudonocardiaceae bacterium]|jgi:acyl carrier protein
MTATTNADSTREELRAMVAHVLYCEASDIDDDTTFTDLGLDSVLIVEFVADVNAKFGVKESVEVLYEHETLNRFAAYLFPRLAGGATPGSA